MKYRRIKYRIAYWIGPALLLTAMEMLRPGATPAAAPSIVFIVNSHNPQNVINRADLVDYYEKRRRLWPNGVDVRFIDRPPGSPERTAFLREILHHSESDVQLYWFGQKLHSGSRMPVQASSDQAVIDLVRSFDGGIGYVSSATSAAALNGAGVKVVKITGVPE